MVATLKKFTIFLRDAPLYNGMYLSDPLLKLRYESGREYIASLEASTDKIRLFWEDTDETEYDWQCFATFPNPDDRSDLATRADKTIVAHRLESEDSLSETIVMD